MRLTMAYVNTTRVAKAGWADRLTNLISDAKAAYAKRRIYVQTVEELNKLTDRELSDLGISRLSINDLAHEAAYGN
jgi:uncharacterized protein YjiS (DUF1127 family)